MFLGFLIIIVLVIGSIVFLNHNQNNKLTKISSTNSVVVTAMPTDVVSRNSSAGNNTEEATVINVTSEGFVPSTINIKAGTKVTWFNISGQTVTVNSDPHPIHTDYPPLNLGEFANGQSVSLVFPKAGTYGYHNHLNPSQKGKVIVQ